METRDASWKREAWAELRDGFPALIGCTLGVATGAAALPFYTAGVFVTALEQNFGWSRRDLSAAGLVWTITVVLCAPFVGGLIDRFGVRGPACLGLCSLAAMFFTFSILNGQLGPYIALQVAGAAAGVASTPVAFTRVINERFDRARGAALGLTLAGTGLTAAFAPSIVAAIVEADGFRAGLRALGWTALAAAGPVFFLLGPGKRGAQAASDAHLPPPAPLKELLRRPIFTRLVIAFFALAVGVGGYVLHMIPMMTDLGLPLARAAAIQGALGISVIGGRVIVGALVDHFFAPRVAAISLAVTCVGMVTLASSGPSVAAPAALAIGFALGAEVDLIGYLTARYFGLEAYGRIYGALYSAFVFGTGASPILIATLQAKTGSYSMGLLVSAAFVAIALVLFATSPRFGEPQHDRA